MGHPILDHLLLALAWASFGVVHSLLAGAGGQRRLDALFGAWARIAYNMIAMLHLAAILAVEQYAFADRLVLAWSEEAQRVLWGVQGLGGALILYAVTRHDIARFTGLAQIRPEIEARFGPKRPHSRNTGPAQAAGQAPGQNSDDAPGDTAEPLQTGGIYRFVRHPLYTGLFLLLWGRLFDEFQIATAVWASAYLVIGARLEEARLLRVHGEAYARYRAAVPAFFPWRGRAWRE